MKIFFYNFGGYTFTDIVEKLMEMGHEVDTWFYHFDSPQMRFSDAVFEENLEQKLKGKNYDLIFSVNFFPLMAKVCYELGLKYVSWSYDSPLASGLEQYFDYDTNYIFLFDRSEVKKYNRRGHGNVFHLPLAVNCDRLSKLSYSQAEIKKYTSDISFVGSLYEPELGGLLIPADDYCRGYIQSAMEVQMSLYGADILEAAITEDLVRKLNKCYADFGQTKVKIDRIGLKYAIQRQITHAERCVLLDALTELGSTKFYSYDRYDQNKNVVNMGPVDYRSEMPGVFRYSRINLCPVLRSIGSGIPLRALDIMACHGVLFINYQEELAENFTDGVDVIMYGSLEEAVEKAGYYLEQETERNAIAGNAYEKVKAQYTYEKAIDSILKKIS